MEVIYCHINWNRLSLSFYHEPPARETGRPLPMYLTVNKLYLTLHLSKHVLDDHVVKRIIKQDQENKERHTLKCDHSSIGEGFGHCIKSVDAGYCQVQEGTANEQERKRLAGLVQMDQTAGVSHVMQQKAP